MPKIALSSYSLRLKRRHAREYLPLDDIESADALSLIREHFDSLAVKLSRDEESKKIVRVDGADVILSGRIIAGIIETGEYGYESEIIDSRKGGIKYKRTVDDAEMLPFYFLFYVPKKRDKGIVILQRFGLYGISKILHDSIEAGIRKKHPDIAVEFNPLISDKIVKQFLDKGSILKIVFRRFDIPADLADYFDTRNPKEIEGHAEFSLIAKKHHNLPIKKRLLQLISQNGEVNKLMEIKHFEYNNVRVQVKYNNDVRTVDLSDFARFRSYYDISNEVKVSASGHPIYSSIDHISRSLLEELNSLLYPRQNVQQN